MRVDAANGNPSVRTITPVPTDEEAAAIAAALTMAWPRPAAEDRSAGSPSTSWRFSGRWWNRQTWKR